ncbi:MAG: acyl-CoA synthetase [Actinobacteria bacterium]|nr:acyl-CoA synthetase [Actinomycetota bacterium]
MPFNLADLFEVVADTCPDRLALVAGDARRTYRDLEERANRFAHHLADAGVAKGDPVAVLAWNRAEWIEAELGIYKARASVINVNYRYVADELRYMLENSDAVALVFERSFAPMVQEVRAGAPKLRHFVVIDDGSSPSDQDAKVAKAVAELGAVDYEDALAAGSPARDFGPRSADDLYILYTGGTTGLPKGVLWRQEDIFFAALGGGGFGQPPITSAEELATRVVADDAVAVQIVNAPMMHGGGQWSSFISFFGGNTVVLNCDHHYDGDRVLRLAEGERATTIMVVGDAMARPLADALAAPDAEYELSCVSVIGSGGAILSCAVREELARRLPDAVVMDSFGASETGHAGTVLDLEHGGPKFTMNPTTNVLDDEGRPVKPGSGQVGRLARRGHIPLGYFKDDEKTAATFLIDPDGERWVVPGDSATIDADGTLHLLGRGSVCINTGGEKVYPEEVEAALKAHPDVFDVVVIGVPDERFQERVAAVVLPRDGAAPTLDSLATFCRDRIAGYKVPRELHLTQEIPRTPVGKPDYRWAKALAMKGTA